MTLTTRRCLPCEGGIPKLTPKEIKAMLPELPDWKFCKEEKLQKEFSFRDFVNAMRFINQMGELAEEEGHHPDFSLFDYRHVRVVLWTHALEGLSENDFIVAAKIDALPMAKSAEKIS